MKKLPLRISWGSIALAVLVSCSGSLESNDEGVSAGTGGAGAVGGASAGTGGATAGSGAASGTSGAGGASSTGGVSATGGAGATSGATATGGAGGSGPTGGSAGSGGLPTTLGPRVGKSSVTVPAGVKDGVQNWSIWRRRDLNVAPVFVAPLANCQTLVCYTSGSASAPTTHVVRLNAQDQLDQVIVNEAGFECRGLAAGDGGAFAALLWNDEGNAEPPLDTIAIRRYDAAGTALGTTALVNGGNDGNHPTDFGIGESRLEFGEGRYGAYYHVHSLSGHEGDTLKWVDAASGAETTDWAWGCSHSMSNLLRYNPGVSDFMNACVTDCYPGTQGSSFATTSIGGIYLNADEKIMDVAAGCNGSVAGELGSAALSPSGFKIVFNAHQAPTVLGQDSYDESTMNQDIGFVSVTGTTTPGSVVWLTTTASVDESDSSIALYQPQGVGEQYLVGWVEGDGAAYKLAIVDGAGAFVEAAIDVSSTVRWGRRDDPFRRHYDGDVVWAWFDQSGSTMLNIGRVDSGVSYTCQ